MLGKNSDAMLHWIENGYLLEQRIENLRKADTSLRRSIQHETIRESETQATSSDSFRDKDCEGNKIQ